MLTACSSGSQPSSDPAAPTVTLTANPASVASGGTAMLTWSTTNATACTASGGWSGAEPTSGNVSTAALTATTSYTLTCAGASGTTPATTSATVTVTASPPPAPTVTLTANPVSVASGGTAMLTWSTTNATACTASGGWSGTEPTSGSVSTAPLVATTIYTLNCSGAGGTAVASTTVSITNPGAMAVTPRTAALTLSQTQQFAASVPGGGSATWSIDGIAGGNAQIGTISASGLYRAPATAGTHTVLATSVADPTQSGNAAIAVTDLKGVFTFHNDLARTGQNLQEYALTPAAVSSANFGKRWSCPVDGEIFAQPLYVANLSIGGGTHNVVFIVTQHDSVYAIDADNPSCVTYWQLALVSGTVTTISYIDLGGCNDMTEFGITGTPVIDPSTQTLYFVAATKESGSFVQRLHALNIQTGAEQSGSPVVIPAQIPGNGATFSALWQNQRPGLVLYGGGVFISWASHCDLQPYWGLMMRYDAATLTQTAVFNVTPNGTEGGIWMSGGAPAVDSFGSMFLSTGNGTFDDTTSALPPVAPENDFSMSFLNMNPATLLVQDFYTPSMEAIWSSPADLDISSAGVVVLPDGMGPTAHPNLLVGLDKQAHLWLIDRQAMSGFSATMDNTVQFLTLPDSNQCPHLNCVFSTPAYYQQTIYVAPVSGPLMALPLAAGLFGATAQNVAIASSLSAETYPYPAGTPTVSASPSGSGIVWVLDNSNFANQGNNGTSPAGPAILRAYSASSVSTALYSSSTLAADSGGNAVKFTVPVVANGHVYVGGGQQLTVYGLAP
jgi:hypothetical protein